MSEASLKLALYHLRDHGPHDAATSTDEAAKLLAELLDAWAHEAVADGYRQGLEAAADICEFHGHQGMANAIRETQP